jgi:putative peptide zinc metalloprotease protein
LLLRDHLRTKAASGSGRETRIVSPETLVDADRNPAAGWLRPMICKVCRRQRPRKAGPCPTCGAAREGGPGAFELVLPDGTEIPITHELSIGRAPGNSLRIADPSISRRHARISPPHDGRPLLLTDAGSTYGSWVDDRRADVPAALREGTRIVLGDVKLAVRLRRGSARNRTIVVPAGASVVLTSTGAAPVQQQVAAYPRLRSGYALKQLDDGWVLRDLVVGDVVRLPEADGLLLGLLDGRHAVADLSREAERQSGGEGPARLALLLADLGLRGLLAGQPVERAEPPRFLRPRQRTWPGAARLFERLYLDGAWRLFTRTALSVAALIAAAGIAAFAYLVVARYGTPFLVARRLAIGGLVFVVGRLAIATFHELAHGLTLASFARRVGAAGVKVILIFPYVFVDTSEAWFEPRRRRIAVSSAGPISDLVLGGAFAFCCLGAPLGTIRDIFFQLAFAAYVGALFNLNPLLERDGYQILTDVLDEPGLRRRALAQLRRRLAGDRRASDSKALSRYALLATAWMVATAAVGIAFSLRYERTLAALVPGPAAWALIAPVWLALLALPVAVVFPRSRQ